MRPRGRWILPDLLECCGGRPPAIDLSVVAGDCEERGRKDRGGRVHCLRRVGPRKGPADVGGRVPDMRADAVRASADVVVKGLGNQGHRACTRSRQRTEGGWQGIKRGGGRAWMFGGTTRKMEGKGGGRGGMQREGKHRRWKVGVNRAVTWTKQLREDNAEIVV